MKSTLMKSMTVIGVGSMLFLTGCASNAPSRVDAASATSSASTAPSTSSSASASPSASPTATALELDPAVTAGMTPEQLENYKQEVARIKAMTPEQREALRVAQNDAHAERLVAAQEVKAGSTLHVSGGKYAPGASITIYGAQQMAPPTYNPETNDYGPSGEEVILTDKMETTADAQGNFDVDLMIPATVTPQMINILGISNDGRSDLIMTTVK